MKRYFICLANSKKYSGRCVAGVELLPRIGEGTRYSIREIGNRPSWMRPVSDDEFGQIDEALVADLQVLDIIEIDVLEDAPDGYQSENVKFDENSLRVLETAPAKTKLLDKLVNPFENPIFGNTGNSVSGEDIDVLGYSLTFIKPKTWTYYEKGYKGKTQTRIQFRHRNIDYDFPVTDLLFCDDIKKNPGLLENIDSLYLTISLGLEFNRDHYKLIAGVIRCE